MMGSLAMGESEKLQYTRENESEADRLGLTYLIRTGYEGRAMISFLKKISRMTEYNAAFPSYLSTHPGVPTRISYLETLIGSFPKSTRVEQSPDRLKHIHLRLYVVEKGPLESLEHFSLLLKTRSDDGEALFGRALAEKEMGRIRESIEDLKVAHSLMPADPQILKELGLAFIRVGRINEGVRALERSLSLLGKDAETLHYLGQGYQAQKKLDLAVESYLKAWEMDPGLPELDRDLGSVYKDRGEMGRSHFFYGLHFKRSNEVKYARFHFRKAWELSAEDPEEQEQVMRELEALKE